MMIEQKKQELTHQILKEMFRVNKRLQVAVEKSEAQTNCPNCLSKEFLLKISKNG